MGGPAEETMLLTRDQAKCPERRRVGPLLAVPTLFPYASAV